MTILVVDPFSSGAEYLPAFRKGAPEGTEIIAVLSHDDVDARLFREPIGFDRVLSWEGQHDTVLGLRGITILVCGCETGVEVADLLAHHFSVPGNPPETSRNRRDKHLMLERLRSTGHEAIVQLLTSDVEEALAWTKAQGFKRCVIKPVDSGGSDMVATVDLEAKGAADVLRKKVRGMLETRNLTGSRNQAVLFQECIEGDEFVVDHVTDRNGHVLTATFRYRKLHTKKGEVLYDTMTLLTPDEASRPDLQSVVRYTREAITCLGIGFGPSHAELMLTDDRGPILIEVGARPHGGIGGPMIARACLGANQVDLWSQWWTNGRELAPPCPERAGQIGLELFLANPGSPVHSATGWSRSHAPDYQLNQFGPRTVDEPFPQDQFRELDGCLHVSWGPDVGAPLEVTTSLVNKPGSIVLVGEPAQVERQLAKARSLYESYLNRLPLRS